MYCVSTTIKKVRPFGCAAQESVYFGVTTDLDADPVILRREQVEHVGSYDHMQGSRAVVTLNCDRRIVKVKVLQDGTEFAIEADVENERSWSA